MDRFPRAGEAAQAPLTSGTGRSWRSVLPTAPVSWGWRDKEGFGETRRILVQAGDEATGPLGCRWLKGLAVAMLACWMLGVLTVRCAAAARSAVIMVRRVIAADRAGGHAPGVP
jgi:hypothetical protein